MPVDDSLGRRAGLLLAAGGGSDAIDDILTSDPGDLRALAAAAGVHVELIAI